MDPSPEPEPPVLAQLLPRHAYHHLVHILRAALPPPPTDAPEDLVHRDNAAIAQVAGLLPANAAEAAVAAQHVAAGAHGMDCLRLALTPRMGLDGAGRLRAQAASMLREARGAMGMLLRMQAARRKIEADSAAAERAAWTEHCAAGLMAQALPAAPPVPEPPPEPDPLPDPIAAAEDYAMHYPQRAALIRRLGRVPDDVSFGPPEDWLVRALATGRSLALLALDRLAVDAHAP